MHEYLAAHRHRGGAVRRPGAGEDHAVSDQKRRDADGSPTRGSCRPPGWSTTSTSTASTTTSARSSSSSARTSPTPPSCASTATSGPSARSPRPGSRSPRWTTGSPRSTTPPRCRPSATLRPPPDRRAATQVAGELPHPFTPADRAAGYRYDISILQAEFSLTQMLDRPVSGRIFFEQVIRDNLDLGRPDQVGLVFDRASTGPPPHPGPVPHPGHHRRRDPQPARRLQARQDQAVPQARPRAANRDDHQRHPRLQDRQTADQPARAAKVGFPANRRLLDVQHSATTPPTAPTPSHGSATRSPPQRRARRRAALRRPPRPGAARGCSCSACTPTASPTPTCATTAPAARRAPAKTAGR